jgi:hypothetical protein
LSAFGAHADAEAKDMSTSLRAALTKDRKSRKDVDLSRNIVRGITKGDTSTPVCSHFQATTLEWISKLRGRYAGIVIRRTVHSVDYSGKRISGLEPYMEHLLVLELYENEISNLHNLADSLVQNSTAGAAKFAAGRVSAMSFY